jgi:hypothetical protein
MASATAPFVISASLAMAVLDSVANAAAADTHRRRRRDEMRNDCCQGHPFGFSCEGSFQKKRTHT